MSDEKKTGIGSITWRDLTVEDAEGVRRFYCEVVGWESRPHDMGEYHDFDILAPGTDESVAGICHARGPNANLPPQWLVYITVEDVDASARTCVELGGAVLDEPRDMGRHRFCVIQDPAGAVAALVSP
ncbi:MAG: VOC family protein [Planctomycetota bacterium]|jgi:predicted enzyme related to lactoylglutathione lyase